MNIIRTATITAAAVMMGLASSVVMAMPSVEHRLQKMTKRLDLTQQQQQEVRAIMESTRARHDEILASYGVDEAVRQQLRDIRHNSVDEIRSVLTKRQQKKFNHMRKARSIAVTPTE